MQFQPRTEQAIQDSKLWTKGDYAFEIIEAAEKVSQSGGNPMIELKVKVSRADGAAKTITDYLLDKTPEKLRHCCAACGAELLRKYDTGIVADDDFVSRRGRLRLGVEKAKKNSGYPDRNVILDYICDNAPSGSGFFGGVGALPR
jgi:hypothetical protein